MRKEDKQKLYDIYKDYFAYNLNITLPPLDVSLSQADLHMPINAHILISILTRLGIEFDRSSTYTGSIVIEPRIWESDSNKNFNVVLQLTRSSPNTTWLERSFDSSMIFKNLIPVINKQSDKLYCNMYYQSDNNVDMWDKDIDTLELIRMYDAEVDSIGGTDILGVLDI